MGNEVMSCLRLQSMLLGLRRVGLRVIVVGLKELRGESIEVGVGGS